MIYFLAGGNNFAINQRLNELLDPFIVQYGNIAVERIDADELPAELIIEAISGLSLLSPDKMVVARGVSDKDLITKLLDIDIPEQTTVIVILGKVDKRASYYKVLKTHTGFEIFDEPSFQNLPAWVQRYAKNNNGEISYIDSRNLVEKVGINQVMLKNELDKLIIYNPKISKQTIDLLVESRPQSSTFMLLKSAFGGRTKDVERIYKELRLQKVEPPIIVGLIGWQLHILAVIKTAKDKTPAEIAKQTKLNLFSIKNSLELAQKLSLSDIKRMVKDVCELDVLIKSVNVDIDQAMLLFLTQITFLK